MLEAVFISDLHLHPQQHTITARFNQFIQWASQATRAVYILGDFLHAWPGDDNVDAWSCAITSRLHWLAKHDVAIYLMPGNRDFLIGKRFAKTASVTLLTEPTIINLDNQAVLLVHGDRYCTNDKSHQWFRRCTRNRLFATLFLGIPLIWRQKMVYRVRQFSQTNRSKSSVKMDVVVDALLAHMRTHQVRTVIHGHTHQPRLNHYQVAGQNYQQYILSDWDDSPQVLCYDSAKGFYFTQIC